MQEEAAASLTSSFDESWKREALKAPADYRERGSC